MIANLLNGRDDSIDWPAAVQRALLLERAERRRERVGARVDHLDAEDELNGFKTAQEMEAALRRVSEHPRLREDWDFNAQVNAWKNARLKYLIATAVQANSSGQIVAAAEAAARRAGDAAARKVALQQQELRNLDREGRPAKLRCIVDGWNPTRQEGRGGRRQARRAILQSFVIEVWRAVRHEVVPSPQPISIRMVLAEMNFPHLPPAEAMAALVARDGERQLARLEKAISKAK